MSDDRREVEDKVNDLASQVAFICRGKPIGLVIAAHMALLEFSLSETGDENRATIIKEIEQFAFHLRHRDWDGND